MILLRNLLSLTLWLLAGLAGLSVTPAAAQERDAVAIIGHGSMPRIDQATAQKLYTGRIVELAGVAVTVLNAPVGSRSRDRFMATVMGMDDDRYVAYWTVRKHIGKGTPPREVRNSAEVIEFVQANPGSLGYVLTSELKPGLNVLLKP